MLLQAFLNQVIQRSGRARLICVLLCVGGTQAVAGCGDAEEGSAAGHGGRSSGGRSGASGGAATTALGGHVVDASDGGVGGLEPTGAEAGSGGVAGDHDHGDSEVLALLIAGPTGGPNKLYAVAAPAFDEARVLSHPIPPNSSVSEFLVSPSGKQVAFTLKSASVAATDVYVANVDGLDVHMVGPEAFAGEESSLDGWSANGDTVRFRRGAHAVKAKADGTSSVEVPSTNYAWSPNEQRVAYVSSGRLVFASADGRETHVATQDASGTVLGEWSADGTLFFTIGSNAVPQLWNAAGTKIETLGACSLRPEWSPAFGGPLVSGDCEGGVVVNSFRSTNSYSSRPSVSNVVSLAWERRGDALALGGDRVWLLSDPSTSIYSTIPITDTFAEPIHAGLLQWSPDGTRLAYAARTAAAVADEVYVSGLTAETSVRVSGSARAGTLVTSLGWSPTAKHLAYRSDHRSPDLQELSVVEVNSGRRINLGANDKSTPATTNWSPDGRFFAFRLAATQNTTALSVRAPGAVMVLDAETFESYQPAAALPPDVVVLDFALGIAESARASQ
jgi:Tol biopolymer transport system component